MVECSYTTILEHRQCYAGYGNGYRGGLYVETGYACLGQVVSSIKISLLKEGNPTGYASCRVWKYSDDSIQVTMGTIDVSTLTTDSAGEYYEFDNPNVTHTLQAGDIMGIEYNGGDSTNKIKFGIEGAGGGGVAYQQLASYPGGTWSLNSSDNFAYYLNAGGPPPSGDTVLFPPPVAFI